MQERLREEALFPRVRVLKPVLGLDNREVARVRVGSVRTFFGVPADSFPVSVFSISAVGFLRPLIQIIKLEGSLKGFRIARHAHFGCCRSHYPQTPEMFSK